MRGRRASAVAAAGAAAAFLAAGSAAFLLRTTAWPEIVTPAWFVSLGWPLYSSIYFPHTPLLILATGLLGKVLGFSAPLLRALAGLPMGAAAALLVAAAGRRRGLGGPAAALVLGVPLVVGWTVYLEGPALWPEYFVSPLALGACLLLESYERRGSRRALAGAGLLLGTSILVKQTSAWLSLAALAWLLLRSRRRGAGAALRLAGSFAAPYAAFAVLWGLFGRTLDHLRWTFLYPVFSRLGSEIRVVPGGAELKEAVAPFLVLAALVLLPASLPPGRRSRSPLGWLALASAAMAWPRWGLFHLAGAAGLLALAGLRSLRAVAALPPVLARLRRRSGGLAPLLAGASAVGLLLVHLAVLVGGAGPLALEAVGGPVHYWDDSVATASARAVSARVPRGGLVFCFNARYETLYPLTGTRPPGGFYVNPAFWYCTNREGIDGRLVEALRANPAVPILFREAEPGVDEAGFRGTALYGFVTRETVVTGEGPSGAQWRAVR